MYGYIYLTTNLINGRKYIGQHQSTEFTELYKGSGKLISQAFKKYGFDNFSVELLEECNSLEELNEAEIKWIKETNAVYSDEYYNIAFGGKNNPSHPLSDEEKAHLSKIMSEIQSNGNGFFKGHKHSDKTKELMRKSHTGLTFKMSEEARRHVSEGHADVSGKNNPMYGKRHSDEVKARIGSKNRAQLLGRVWVTNQIEDHFIKQEDLQAYLSSGFTLGRRYHKRGNNRRKSSTTIESIGNEKDITE